MQDWFDKRFFGVLSVIYLVVLFGVISSFSVVGVIGESMEPSLEQGDQVLVYEHADVSKGDVVYFSTEGNDVIHRAEFYVEEGDNWVAELDEKYTNGKDCDETHGCPAPHDGWVTVGINNGYADQIHNHHTLSYPITEEEIEGVVIFVF